MCELDELIEIPANHVSSLVDVGDTMHETLDA